jgi:hypothetical protein
LAIDTDKVRMLETALDRLSTASRDRALVLATLCSELTFGSPVERRQALADQALAIAHSCGDDATIVRVVNHVTVPLQVPALLEQSLARTADAMVRAARVGDPVLLYRTADCRKIEAYRAGDVDEADRCFEIMGPMAEQLDQPSLNWELTYARAGRAQIAGDNDRAEELATEALQLGTDCGEPDATLIFGLQLVAVSGQRGSLGERVPRLEQAVAEAPGVVAMTASLAMALTDAGRFNAARRRWSSSPRQTSSFLWT